MSTLRTTNVIHGSSAISNIVLDNQGRAIFGPDSPAGRAALYVNAQNNRVGINTETPGVTLDVNGNVNFTGNTNITGNVVFDGRLNVTGDIEFDGTSVINGIIRFENQVQVAGSATADANVFIQYDGSTPETELILSKGDGRLYIGGSDLDTATPLGNIGLLPDGFAFFQNNLSVGNRSNRTSVAPVISCEMIEDTAYDRNDILYDGYSSIFARNESRANTSGSYVGLGFEAFSDTGNLTKAAIGLTKTSSSGSNGALIFGIRNNSFSNVIERMRLNSSGNLLVGTASDANNLRLNQNLALVNTGQNTYGGASFTSYSGTDATARAVLDFQRSRGTTDGSMTVVTRDDELGSIIWRGSNGTNFLDSALISGAVDGTPGTNDMPGRIMFFTTADGATNSTEAARIDNQQRIWINTDGITNGVYRDSTTKLNVGGAGDIGGIYNGVAENDDNSNNRTIFIFRLDNNSDGFQFAGEIITNSYTGNAYVRAHIGVRYTNHTDIDVDVLSANNVSISGKTNLRVITCDFDGKTYLGIQKAGGGTGVLFFNGLLSGNIDLPGNGGVRAVYNTTLSNVTEIAKLNY